MNIKIKSLKKSLFNACNKLIVSNNSSQSKQASSFETSDVQTPTFVYNHKKKTSLLKKSKKVAATRKTMHSGSVSRSISSESISLCYEEVKCESNLNQVFASASSGYGTTSVKSALSIFVNLDNYFYDENFAKVATLSSE